MEWVERAQDFGSDRGVSWGTKFGQGFQPSYPETTGYIISTFLELARIFGKSEYRRRAIEMGLWEVATQMKSGAVMGGTVSSNPNPAVFNTGQVLLGWASLYEETHDDRFAIAGQCAATWMMSLQELDGRWIRGNSNYARKDATLYNVKAAWGLARMGRALNYEQPVQAAIRNGEYTVARQTPNGWFPDCCLTDPRRPLLHTIAYTLQGLLGLGELTGRNDFIACATLTADKLLSLMDPEGFIPGRLNCSMNGAVKWCCLTGTAQTSVIWSQLYELTQQRKYRDAVHRANRYLMARHDIESPDPSIRGGLTGSWPIWGDFCPFMATSSSAKFFIDALVAEKRFSTPVTTGRTENDLHQDSWSTLSGTGPESQAKFARHLTGN